MANRFVKIEREGTLNGSEIWVDRETGVNYFFHFSGSAAGLTPLLNANGTPIVTPLSPED
ncbi:MULTISPECIES: DUF6440 family protein [unclassified Oscillibacter]|uniref:DUF6440 family protein n=1 Tax=unclassified Oscillibacter TaxID=2629304 RepID=UPI0025F3E031|nr:MULTISPECIES: DUF6440 family protein [unclassified Oscillibacter]